MKQYNKSEIDMISNQANGMGGTEVVYRPMMDSLYYCPGIKVRDNAERKKITFIRCSIKDKCPVDISSESMEAGQFKVVVPFAPAQIDLIFGDGEIKLLR